MDKIVKILKRARNCFRKKKYKKSDFGTIGEEVIINQSSKLVPQNMYIDDHVIIQGDVNFISFKGKLFVKRYSVISSGCIIVPSRHIPSVGIPFFYATKYHIGDEDSSVKIEEDCWIGAGSILLSGITVGRGAIVGAGSVVSKNIPPYSIVVGTPAKVISVKFSLEDIITHEAELYPESERFSIEELQILFNTVYKSLPISRKVEISKKERELIRLQVFK